MYYDNRKMDDQADYLNKLISTLETKGESLEKTTIVSLRNHFQEFESSISTIYKFLIEKGIMQKDPYRNDKTITELKVPSSRMLPEMDSQQEVSLRFSHYTSQWEFLVKIFHVSLTNLSLKKIHTIMELLSYIRWNDLSTTSSYQITRAVAGMLARVSQMNDPMAGKIISSSAGNLGKITLKIKADLKTLTVFMRERYKAEVREKITSNMNINIEQYRRKPDSIMDNVKFEFSHKMKEAGWYKELINELLEEDFGTAGEKLRAEVLEKLKIDKPAKKKAKNVGINDKAMIGRIMELLSRTSEPIRSALIRMNENSRTIHDRKKPLAERLSELFSNLFSRSDNKVIYEIKIKDPVTGAERVEALNFTEFSALTLRKARLLQELQDPESPPRKKIDAVGTQKAIEYISANLSELKTIHRRLTGLDRYFQSNEIPREIKGAMKSSTLSLTNLKSYILDTIKQFNDFKIKWEEFEQLKKLGIIN